MAAVHHWFAGEQHAQLTGDVSVLDDMSWGTCEACETRMTMWTEHVAEECTVEQQGERDVRTYNATMFDGWHQATVSVAFSDSGKVLRGDGCEGEVEAYDQDLEIDLTYGGIDGYWKVQGVWAVDEDAEESG